LSSVETAVKICLKTLSGVMGLLIGLCQC